MFYSKFQRPSQWTRVPVTRMPLRSPRHCTDPFGCSVVVWWHLSVFRDGMIHHHWLPIQLSSELHGAWLWTAQSHSHTAHREHCLWCHSLMYAYGRQCFYFHDMVEMPLHRSPKLFGKQFWISQCQRQWSEMLGCMRLITSHRYRLLTSKLNWVLTFPNPRQIFVHLHPYCLFCEHIKIAALH